MFLFDSTLTTGVVFGSIFIAETVSVWCVFAISFAMCLHNISKWLPSRSIESMRVVDRKGFWVVSSPRVPKERRLGPSQLPTWKYDRKKYALHFMTRAAFGLRTSNYKWFQKLLCSSYFQLTPVSLSRIPILDETLFGDWSLKPHLHEQVFHDKFSLTRKNWQFFVVYTSKSSLSRKTCQGKLVKENLLV